MTVYSINKRAIEQAKTMTPAANAPKSTSDAVAEFASALQKAGSLFTAGAQPSAETALKAHFDRAAEPARPAKAEKPEKAEAKSEIRARRDDDKNARRAEKAEVKEARREQKPEKVEEATGRTEIVVEDKGDDAPVATNADGQQQESSSQQQAPEQQVIAAPVQVAVEQVAEVVETEGDVVVDVDGQAQAQAPVELDAADAGDEGDAGQLAGQQIQDAGDQGDDAQLADAAAKALRSGAHEAARDAGEGKADAAQAQANDLAQRLDGTGAKIKMQVDVASADQDVAAETTAIDPLAQQAAGAQPQTADNAADGDTGNQQPGVALAAQQAAARQAQEAAALAGRAAQAKPFDAALAAQLEANKPAQAQQPQTQPVAGLGNVTAATATQKAQAPQAAQAPRQPQLPVDEQHVIDQVKVQITKAGKNGDTIKLQLKPVELGAIEIKVEVAQDGRVSAVVTADSKQTLDILQKDASSLHKALEDAGLKPDSNSLSFNLREGAQQGQQSNSAPTRRKSRLSVAAAADAANAQAAAAAQARWNTGRAGVNIEV